ncbi:MAG: GNAT family N-acetyltransferase [Gammaproteobacteria bacterium]|nr:GNAT family N-acetyltransferase [Gammaproteobacteria bacterium]
MLTIRELEQADYANALRQFYQRTLFHECDWLDSIVRIYRVEICYVGAFEGEDLVGMIPVLIRRFSGVRVAGSPLPQVATPRLFPLVDEERFPPFLAALRQWAKEKGLSHLQVACRDCVHRECVGWESEIRDTLKVALDKELEALWGAFNQNARRAVRKTIRNGVRLHWRRSRKFIDETYQAFLHSTYDHQGIRPNCPIELYRELEQRLPRRHWRILTASWRGKDIASVWLLLDEHQCYFWDGASDQSMRRLQANNLLHWAAIRWSRKRRLAAYDLLGGEASSSRAGGRQGIGRFKKSLGGARSEYVVFVWQRQWMRFALAFYRVYLRLRDRTGLFGGS